MNKEKKKRKCSTWWQCFAKNSAPILSDPLPDKHWTVVTLFSMIAGLNPKK